MKGVIVHCKKQSENGDDDTYQKIYAYMARMSGNDEIYSRYFGDI